jgi:hypothetical protein
VSTIDWHKRQGRIKSRGRRAASLERASVEEFAQWWNARQADRTLARQESAQRSRRPPDGEGWLPPRDAAEVLEISPVHVGYLVKHGRLPGTVHNGRVWVRDTDARAYKLEESRWISSVTASVIIGLSPSKVGDLARAGFIERRPNVGRAASLDRSSVERYAEEYRASLEEKRRNQPPEREPAQPPDDGRVWLDTETTAVVLGISGTRVRQLARRDRLPFTERGGRRWFLREHVEQVAAKRAIDVAART